MKPVTRYEADDGSVWSTPEEATGRDREAAAAADVMSPLRPRHIGTCNDYQNGWGYVQHDPGIVKAVKRTLIAASRTKVSNWIERLEVAGVDLMSVPPSSFARVVDDYGPLALAWGRLCCIDEQSREWGQPAYADPCNDGRRIKVCVRKGAG